MPFHKLLIFSIFNRLIEVFIHSINILLINKNNIKFVVISLTVSSPPSSVQQMFLFSYLSSSLSADLSDSFHPKAPYLLHFCLRIRSIQIPFSTSSKSLFWKSTCSTVAILVISHSLSHKILIGSTFQIFQSLNIFEIFSIFHLFIGFTSLFSFFLFHH